MVDSTGLSHTNPTNPNSLPSTNKSTRTRITFGSRLNDAYIGSRVFECLKEFVSLPPADYYILDQEIVYTIPPSQVLRGDPRSVYLLHSDFEFTDVVFNCLTPVGPCVRLDPVSPCDDFDRIFLQDEQQSREGFVLVENSAYSDVELRTRIRQIETIWNGDIWLWEFFEVLRHPYRDVNNPKYIYFRDAPVYSVNLYAPHVVTPTEVTSFLYWSLPDRFNKYAGRPEN